MKLKKKKNWSRRNAHVFFSCSSIYVYLVNIYCIIHISINKKITMQREHPNTAAEKMNLHLERECCCCGETEKKDRCI